MADETSTPPPLPDQPAAQAARSAAPAAAPAAPSAPAADAGLGVDDTGVPRLVGEVDDIGRGFLSALFDITFSTFITRRLASVFYVVGLVAIGIGFIAAFFGGVIGGIRALWWNLGGGISLIVSTVIVAPILAFLAVVVLRFVIEAVVALVAVAENTERTARNTDRV
ncbi:DUF4282 domain-containing protein [Microbacterium telephonicum]|uniref:Uncharacterized protein DUF4282 n=1 Tax=Microbacterium telephonicum TaxID=1714841 RepID=A0A498C4Z3_9MICO|nr:DUF4282 domain-containing protein [Microbacterium telephonicum]RLK47571.1 uncharacterized protein DUF4282 [Microbacterium telephonicum]